MKTTPNSAYVPSANPRGVFIGTREEGGQGTNPGPKRGLDRISAAIRPRRTRRFGPGFVPWPPVPLVSINTPLGFQN